jgi:hypothetical protein
MGIRNDREARWATMMTRTMTNHNDDGRRTLTTNDEPGLGEGGMTLKRRVVGEADNEPQVRHHNIIFNLILNSVDYYMLNIVHRMIIFIFSPPQERLYRDYTTK